MFGPKDGVGQIEEDTQELTNTLETATHKDTKKNLFISSNKLY